MGLGREMGGPLSTSQQRCGCAGEGVIHEHWLCNRNGPTFFGACPGTWRLFEYTKPVSRCRSPPHHLFWLGRGPAEPYFANFSGIFPARCLRI